MARIENLLILCATVGNMMLDAGCTGGSKQSPLSLDASVDSKSAAMTVAIGGDVFRFKVGGGEIVARQYHLVLRPWGLREDFVRSSGCHIHDWNEDRQFDLRGDVVCW